MPEGLYATDVVVKDGPAPVPAAPGLSVVFPDNGDKAVATVILPAVDSIGRPLASLKQLLVFCQATSLIATIESWWTGVTPAVTFPLTPEEIGQTVTVEIPDLPWDTEFRFTARCDD
jgi:hypothetical protein